MTGRNESATGAHIYYKDEDGKGHNIPLQGKDGAAFVIDIPNKIVHTIIDNDTFDETVESEDIDLSLVKKGIITIVTGTVTDTCTMDVSLQIKDSNNNYMDYLDFIAPVDTLDYTSIPKTGRIVCTKGGNGSIAGVTVELTVY
ncbi:hypothetical protein [Methanobacterium spitsbergense]|uniref:Uncharacterized protein n=1 Tax=Methanobacterium spitsbergense TaxID=2874285 RepID=A0A8T5V1U4_9EURY|nr:hypothetical protein [Methanobacterium spitsbergense]MBZ2167023.1 hypothetical protein [Methanobacterium spitsbergense]